MVPSRAQKYFALNENSKTTPCDDALMHIKSYLVVYAIETIKLKNGGSSSAISCELDACRAAWLRFVRRNCWLRLCARSQTMVRARVLSLCSFFSLLSCRNPECISLPALSLSHSPCSFLRVLDWKLLARFRLGCDTERKNCVDPKIHKHAGRYLLFKVVKLVKATLLNVFSYTTQ